VDLKASYKWRNIRGFVGVNNITDQQHSEYVVASSGGYRVFYPAPERNWTAGIQIEF
jgi:outer membrane receptor protein involved in Fe transport